MDEYETEEKAIIKKGDLKSLSNEEVELSRMALSYQKKALEAGATLAGKLIDFKDKEQDRKMRMLMYADKSMKWSENFEEIKKNNARMYEFLSKQFKDRRDTIDKAFEIIDKGLKDNNMEAVLIAFGKMADMVAHSPLAEVAAAAHKAFEAGNISDLDPV